MDYYYFFTKEREKKAKNARCLFNPPGQTRVETRRPVLTFSLSHRVYCTPLPRLPSQLVREAGDLQVDDWGKLSLRQLRKAGNLDSRPQVAADAKAGGNIHGNDHTIASARRASSLGPPPRALLPPWSPSPSAFLPAAGFKLPPTRLPETIPFSAPAHLCLAPRSLGSGPRQLMAGLGPSPLGPPKQRRPKAAAIRLPNNLLPSPHLFLSSPAESASGVHASRASARSSAAGTASGFSPLLCASAVRFPKL